MFSPTFVSLSTSEPTKAENRKETTSPEVAGRQIPDGRKGIPKRVKKISKGDVTRNHRHPVEIQRENGVQRKDGYTRETDGWGSDYKSNIYSLYTLDNHLVLLPHRYLLLPLLLLHHARIHQRFLADGTSLYHVT